MLVLQLLRHRGKLVVRRGQEVLEGVRRRGQQGRSEPSVIANKTVASVEQAAAAAGLGQQRCVMHVHAGGPHGGAAP